MPVDHVWKERCEELIREREIDKLLDLGDGQDHFETTWKKRIEPDEAIERLVNFLYKLFEAGPPTP